MKIATGNAELFLNSKQLKSLDLFWAGFIIYIVTATVSITGYVDVVICQGIGVIGLALVIYAATSLFKVKFDDQYLQSVFSVFIIWTLITIARGFAFDYGSLKQQFLDPGFGVMGYLAPLILLFPRNIGFYKKTVEFIIVSGICYVLFVAVFFKDMRSYDVTDLLSQALVEYFAEMSKPLLFIFITYYYHSNKQRIFAAAVLLLTLYFALVRARRGLLYTTLFTSITSFILFLSNTKQKGLTILMSVILVAVAFFYLSSKSGSKGGDIFTFLNARKDEDTRSNVEVSFYEDMATKDMIIGRGLNGEYYCPGVENVMNNTSNRNVIETGYLQLILKGGIIILVLLGLILIPAIIKGFFYSKNVLSKGAALWILLWILYLYPAIGNSFYMYYLLVWISVGICYSKKIRNMSDEEIKEGFQK